MSRSRHYPESYIQAASAQKPSAAELLGWCVIAVVSTGYLYLAGLLGSFSGYYTIALTLAVIFTIARLPRALGQIRFPALFVLFAVSLIPGIALADFGTYSLTKLSGLAIALLLILIPSAALRPAHAANFTLASAAILCFALTIKLLTSGQTLSNSQITLDTLNSVHAGRAVGLCATMLSIYILAGPRRHKAIRLLALGPWSIAVYSLAVVGARGPALSALIAVVSVVVVLILRKRAPWWVAAAAIAGGFVAATLLDSYSSRLFSEGTSGRDEIYSRALAFMVDNPLGVGWGNYSLTPGATYQWPHNIFLELGVEGGWFAMLLFMVLAAATIILAWRLAISSGGTTDLARLAFLVFALTNAQFSADISGNGIVWASIGFVLATSRLDSRPSTAVEASRFRLTRGSLRG